MPNKKNKKKFKKTIDKITNRCYNTSVKRGKTYEKKKIKKRN